MEQNKDFFVILSREGIFARVALAHDDTGYLVANYPYAMVSGDALEKLYIRLFADGRTSQDKTFWRSIGIPDGEYQKYGVLKNGKALIMLESFEPSEIETIIHTKKLEH